MVVCNSVRQKCCPGAGVAPKFVQGASAKCMCPRSRGAHASDPAAHCSASASGRDSARTHKQLTNSTTASAPMVIVQQDDPHAMVRRRAVRPPAQAAALVRLHLGHCLAAAPRHHAAIFCAGEQVATGEPAGRSRRVRGDLAPVACVEHGCHGCRRLHAVVACCIGSAQARRIASMTRALRADIFKTPLLPHAQKQSVLLLP